MRKLLIILSIILIISIFAVSCFAATSGTYEYNDFALYNTNGTWYSSGAFRSDSNSLSTFTITVNVFNNTWNITGGTSTNIPFPTGVTIDYTDRTTFLTTAYATVNGNTYNFTYVSGSDTSGNYYIQNIPAGPYYPQVNLYLPTTGTPVDVPTTPILTYNDGWLHWTPSGYYTEIYLSDSQSLAGSLLRTGLTGDSMKIREDEDGYYYIRFRYSVNGEYRYTDYSNRVYGEYVQASGEEPSTLDKILDYLENIRTTFRNAGSTLMQFISEINSTIQEIFAWLPSDIFNVFVAVVVVGLVIGLILK